MEFNSRFFSAALRKHGVRYLYHANTVRTAKTFLEQGQLLSRGAVEQQGLSQTPQDSDALDKQFGIWEDVFLDSVDIHYRARRRNLYGPVLFVFPVSILDGPEINAIWVTRRNPIHWRTADTDLDRYYSSVPDFDSQFTYGDFYKHIMVRNRDRISLSQVDRIVIDDPGYNPSTLLDEAVSCLKQAAVRGGIVSANVFSIRECRMECKCEKEYAALPTHARERMYSC